MSDPRLSSDQPKSFHIANIWSPKLHCILALQWISKNIKKFQAPPSITELLNDTELLNQYGTDPS